MKAWTLDDILAPVKLEDFLTRTLGKHWLHVPGELPKFSTLLSWSDINTILCCSGLDLTRVHVSGSDGEVPAQHFCRDSLSGFSFLSVTELNQLLGDGASLTIDAAEDLHQPILEFCRAIEGSLGVPVQAQIRFGFRGGASSGMRSYDHDMIIFELIGQSGWQLEGKSLTGPHADPACSTPSTLNVTLNPGDLLYLQRGERHAEQFFNEPVIFLTVIFKNPTGVELIGRLFDRLKETDIVKVDVPRFAGDDIQARYLTELQAEILRVCTEPGLLLGFMKDLWSISEPRRSLSLPWSAIGDLSHLPQHMELRAAIRFPHEDSLIYLGQEETFEIVHEFRRVRLDQVGARIMECLLRSRVLSVAALLESCRTPQGQVLASLSELVKLGLIIVREPSVTTAPG